MINRPVVTRIWVARTEMNGQKRSEFTVNVVATTAETLEVQAERIQRKDKR